MEWEDEVRKHAHLHALNVFQHCKGALQSVAHKLAKVNEGRAPLLAEEERSQPPRAMDRGDNVALGKALAD